MNYPQECAGKGKKDRAEATKQARGLASLSRRAVYVVVRDGAFATTHVYPGESAAHVCVTIYREPVIVGDVPAVLP